MPSNESTTIPFLNRGKFVESKIVKWGRDNWWVNLERTAITEGEIEELGRLASYDQALSTVGRGIQCFDCGKKEAELYNQYYPEK